MLWGVVRVFCHHGAVWCGEAGQLWSTQPGVGDSVAGLVYLFIYLPSVYSARYIGTSKANNYN